MDSTLQQVPPYLGIDLTDRYARTCRPIDVCGLVPLKGNKFTAVFWLWTWDPGSKPLKIDRIAEELGRCRVAMIDGPQGLAAKRRQIRECERITGAPGHTPWERPPAGRPFSGFIRSSLDLFAALDQARIPIGADEPGGVYEVYPGNIWRRLAQAALPPKSSEAGRRTRATILERLGVCGLPPLPTHDQNDACIAAVMAAAMDGKVKGLGVKMVGDPLARDPDGTLREGCMVVPDRKGMGPNNSE